MAYDQPSSMHALAFRVMRLSKPSITVNPCPMKLDLSADMIADNATDLASWPPQPDAARDTAQAHPFASRIQLGAPSQGFGCDGLLQLPQSFGSIHLGETFTSYISVGNYADEAVSTVGIKAELQTERQKTILYDITSTPLASLEPGGRHDFLVKHDIKELGAHTLVCSTVYTSPEGERKYMPQYFKFSATNPLSVRTKTRQVLDNTFLEASLENTTKGLLLLEYVRFDPAPGVQVNTIDVREALTTSDAATGPLGKYITSVTALQPNGGVQQFLFHLQRPTKSQGPSSRPSKDGNALGKLEIKWRNSMGEVGRLQTQQIVGQSEPRKEVSMQVDHVPAQWRLGQPCCVRVVVVNNVDRRMGPLAVGLTPAGSQGLQRAGAQAASVVVSGPDSVLVGELEPQEQRLVDVQMVALHTGVQRLAALHVYDTRDDKVYDSINNLEAFVS